MRSGIGCEARKGNECNKAIWAPQDEGCHAVRIAGASFGQSRYQTKSLCVSEHAVIAGAVSKKNRYTVFLLWEASSHAVPAVSSS